MGFYCIYREIETETETDRARVKETERKGTECGEKKFYMIFNI